MIKKSVIKEIDKDVINAWKYDIVVVDKGGDI